MIRVGVLGFAHGHVMSYGGEWNSNDSYGVRIVAGWDHDAERLQKSCETFGAQACDTPEAALAAARRHEDDIVAKMQLHIDAGNARAELPARAAAIAA